MSSHATDLVVYAKIFYIFSAVKTRSEFARGGTGDREGHTSSEFWRSPTLALLFIRENAGAHLIYRVGWCLYTDM